MSSRTFLSIGGITIDLRCDDDRIACAPAEPLSRFAVPPPPSADVSLDVRAFDRIPEADGELLFDSHAVWKMFRDGGGYRMECRSEAFGNEPYKIARFDESFTCGEVLMRSDLLDARLHPLDYPLDEVLVANLLARGRGVEIHSCGVVDRSGRGHLFAGVSGAGKTTTARLWQDEASAIVSDDRVIVREMQGAMRMFGTPWHGEAELSLPQSAPLAGIYLLVQSDTNELRDLPRAEAVARLFRCTFPLFHDASALAFTLSYLERIAASVPVRELRFAIEPAAVSLVLRETV